MQSVSTQLLELQDVVRYDSVNAQGRGGFKHLSAILPAVSAALGAPISTPVHVDPQAAREALRIPHVTSAVVVLIDGVGFWNLVERKGHAPYLRSLLSRDHNDTPISSCFPTTTVSAMGVFGTGTCPGLTGMTGYTQINPETGQLCQMIQFTNAPDPEDLQKVPTIFEQLSNKGMRVTTSGLPKFATSALTRAALRGTRYISSAHSQTRVTAAANSSKNPGLTYLYMRDADKMGHQYGWNDERWIGAFEHVDAQLKTLASTCAPGTAIIITADHGMINSNPYNRIDIADHPKLDEGVKLIGGEPRMVSLYTHDDVNPDDVAMRWRDFLGDNARVYTKAEAISAGMYGIVAPEHEAILGDVIVCAGSDMTIVDRRTQSDVAMALPSVHGSITAAELDIPFLIDIV